LHTRCGSASWIDFDEGAEAEIDRETPCRTVDDFEVDVGFKTSLGDINSGVGPIGEGFDDSVV